MYKSSASFKFPPAPPNTEKTENVEPGDKLDYDLIRNWAKLSIESMEDRLERYVNYFTPSTTRIRLMVNAFEHELELGLKAHYNEPYTWKASFCSFKMLDSCVMNLPTGKEQGVYYALDFGGTNFRVVRTQLKGNSKVVLNQFKQSLLSAPNAQNLPKGLLDSKATATKMFDFFSLACKELMVQESDLKPGGKEKRQGYSSQNCLKAGFTFSFPCSQRRINSATLMEWTKGFETGRSTNDPVEGLNVAELMNAGFERQKIPLEVCAVLNDTVGTLLAGCYEMDPKSHPPCLIGLILGTGVNAAYYEKMAPEYGYQGRVINVECGNFNRELPLTNVDHELDFAETSNRGRQRLEKMIAGAYLGELARRVIIKVLQHRSPDLAWKSFSFSSENLSRVIEDTSADFSTTASLLMELWCQVFSYSELSAIHRLCCVVVDRAASLAAVIIAATARKTRHLQPAMGGVSVAVDGSLYKLVPFFQRQLREHLNNILGKNVSGLIHLISADDGSGKGAAILAATLSSK